MSNPIYYGDAVYIISGNGWLADTWTVTGGDNQGDCSSSDLSEAGFAATCPPTCTSKAGPVPPDTFQIFDTTGSIPSPNFAVEYKTPLTVYNQTRGAWWLGPLTSGGHCLLQMSSGAQQAIISLTPCPPGTTPPCTQPYSSTTVMAEVYPGLGDTPPNIWIGLVQGIDPSDQTSLMMPTSDTNENALVLNKDIATYFSFYLASAPSPTPPSPGPGPSPGPTPGPTPVPVPLGPAGIAPSPSIPSLLTWQLFAALGSALVGFLAVVWGGVQKSKIGIMLGIVLLLLGMVFFGLWAREYWS